MRNQTHAWDLTGLDLMAGPQDNARLILPGHRKFHVEAAAALRQGLRILVRDSSGRSLLVQVNVVRCPELGEFCPCTLADLVDAMWIDYSVGLAPWYWPSQGPVHDAGVAWFLVVDEE